jgi:deoxyribodipyrimidine photo-lyase
MYVFIFRRDLRIDDNTGFLQLLREASGVICPIFIFNGRQIDADKNPYHSQNSVEFMFQSLASLEAELMSRLNLRLRYFYASDGDEVAILRKLGDIKAIYSNMDLTPYARERDAAIDGLKLVEDYTLTAIEQIKSGSGKPYTVFSPFYRRCLKDAVREPVMCKSEHRESCKGAIAGELTLNEAALRFCPNSNKYLNVQGGRRRGLAILERIRAGEFRDYDKVRDFPGRPRTTLLSAYNKFGCVSIREVYHAILAAYGKEHGLIRELYWREFYALLAFYNPDILRGKSMRPAYDRIRWSSPGKNFELWKEGKTGFPIVDAGMRQLNATGFMHNRLRMIVSMFLCKDLHIDWREGERYFASRLVDYDPAQNNGGWQWSSSSGADSQPYFRIFNPWLQGERYDPECEYIKRWVPELRELSTKEIHGWYKYAESKSVSVRYPVPVVEHAEEVAKTREYYEAGLRAG